LSGEAAELATNRYVGTDNDAAGSVFRVGLLLISGLGYCLLIQNNWVNAYSEDYKLVSLGALIMCALMLLLPVSTVIGDRFGYYVIPLQAMILARIPYLPIKRARQVYAAAPYLVLGLAFLDWASLSSQFGECYVPYKTWIFGVPTSCDFSY
jgi:hypothetical protein